MNTSRKLKRGDFIILLFAGVASAVLFIWKYLNNNRFTNDEKLIAEVRRDGKLITEIDLNNVTKTEYIQFDEGIKVVIEAENGRVRFLSSECPDQVCVHTGWLTKQGHTAACLPSKTIVTL